MNHRFLYDFTIYKYKIIIVFVLYQAITELVKCTEGDMRKAVTFLQSVARFRTNQTVTTADVHDITGVCDLIEL